MYLTVEERKLLPLLAKVILQERLSLKASYLEKSSQSVKPDIRLQYSLQRPNSFGIRYKVSAKSVKLPPKKREPPKPDIVESCQLEECRDETEIPNKVDFKKIGIERLLEELYTLLKTLTPREVDILKRRYCLSDREDWTLDALGAEYGISRQRVQQIEQNALKKLRKALNDKFSEK